MTVCVHDYNTGKKTYCIFIVLACMPTENLNTNRLCDSVPVADHKAESKTFTQTRLSNFILNITAYQGLKS